MPPTFLLKFFAIASLSGIVTIILLSLVHVPKSFDDTKDEDQQQSLVDALKTVLHLFKEYRWLLIGVIFWAITLAIDSGAGDVILPLYVIPLSSKITWSYVSAALSIGYIAGIGFELGGVTWGSALQQRSPEKYLGRISSLDYAVSFGFIPFAYAGYALIEKQYYSNALIITTAIIVIMALIFSALMIRLEKTCNLWGVAYCNTPPPSN